jgi:hypothetical protein
MAGKKITELSGSIAPSLTGVTVVAFGGQTYKSTLSTLRQTLVDSGSHYLTGSQFINGDLTINGSSYFGDNRNDLHRFTGSVLVSGSVNATTLVAQEFLFVSGFAVIGEPIHHTGSDPEALHVGNSNSYNIAHFKGDNEYYSQVYISNHNSGSNASSDLVIVADNGTETNHYIDLGINSSTYTGGLVGLENDAYLLNVGKDMYVGTVGGSNHPANLKLFAQNLWENPQISISGSRQISFNTGSVSSGYTYEFSGSAKMQNELNVGGSITSSYFVGDGSRLTNLPIQTTDVSMFLSSSTFTSASASFDSRITSATNEQDLSYFATTGSNTFIGNQIISGSLNIATNGGDEGGEILLGKAITNTTLTGSGVVMDVFRDRVRIFEDSGSTRGAFLNVASQSANVGSQIVTSPNLFSIQTITSASYASLTPVSGTLYIIID